MNQRARSLLSEAFCRIRGADVRPTLHACHDAVRRVGRVPRSLLVAPCAVAAVLLAPAAHAEQIGEVSTVFRFVGKNDRIVIEAYDDPKVQGVTCFVSRARTGGVSGSLGLAEDRAEASIACRAVGDRIVFREPLPRQEDAFTERMSILFKQLHIVRLVDPRRNALVYLTYSDKIIEGSPQNSVTAVPVPLSNPIPLAK